MATQPSYYTPDAMQFGPDFGAAANIMLGGAQLIGQQQLAGQALQLERIRMDRESTNDSFKNVLEIQRENRAAQNDQFQNTMQMMKMAAETEMQRQQMKAAQLQLENLQKESEAADAAGRLQTKLAPLQLAVAQNNGLDYMDQLHDITNDADYKKAKALWPVMAEIIQKAGAIKFDTDEGPKTLSELGTGMGIQDSKAQVTALRAIMQTSVSAINTPEAEEVLFAKLNKLGVLKDVNDDVMRQKILNTVRTKPQLLSPAEQQRNDQIQASLDAKLGDALAEAIIAKDPGLIQDVSDAYAVSKSALWQSLRKGSVSPFESADHMMIGNGVDALQTKAIEKLDKFRSLMLDSVNGIGNRSIDPIALEKLATQGGMEKAFATINPFSSVVSADSYADVQKFITARGGNDLRTAKVVGADPMSTVSVSDMLKTTAKGVLTLGVGPATAIANDLSIIEERRNSVTYDFEQLKAAMAGMSNPSTVTPERLTQFYKALGEVNNTGMVLGWSKLEIYDIFDKNYLRQLNSMAQRNARSIARLTEGYQTGMLGPVAPASTSVAPAGDVFNSATKSQ